MKIIVGLEKPAPNEMPKSRHKNVAEKRHDWLSPPLLVKGPEYPLKARTPVLKNEINLCKLKFNDTQLISSNLWTDKTGWTDRQQARYNIYVHTI